MGYESIVQSKGRQVLILFQTTNFFYLMHSYLQRNECKAEIHI